MPGYLFSTPSTPAFGAVAAKGYFPASYRYFLCHRSSISMTGGCAKTKIPDPHWSSNNRVLDAQSPLLLLLMYFTGQLQARRKWSLWLRIPMIDLFIG